MQGLGSTYEVQEMTSQWGPPSLPSFSEPPIPVYTSDYRRWQICTYSHGLHLPYLPRSRYRYSDVRNLRSRSVTTFVSHDLMSDFFWSNEPLGFRTSPFPRRSGFQAWSCVQRIVVKFWQEYESCSSRRSGSLYCQQTPVE